MPLKQKIVWCVNHPDIAMIQNEGFNALIRLQRSGNTLSFDSSQGAPVLMYSCPECGYVEMYAAQKTALWHDEAVRDGEGSISAVAFELTVLRALIGPSSPLSPRSMDVAPEIKGLESTLRPDAIIHSDEAAYVVEVKAGTSRQLIERGIHQVSRYARALAKNAEMRRMNQLVIPILVCPAQTNIKTTGEVLILKYDMDRDEFTNQHEFLGLLFAHYGVRN
jgi:hypothetical protein